MSVAELIEQLKNCNQDATVLVAIDAGDGYRLDCVENSKNIVCLVGATIDY